MAVLCVPTFPRGCVEVVLYTLRAQYPRHVAHVSGASLPVRVVKLRVVVRARHHVHLSCRGRRGYRR